MPDANRPPDARPMFRKFATGLAVVLFGLATIFTFVVPQQDDLAPKLCVFVGCIMLAIGATGNWPPSNG